MNDFTMKYIIGIKIIANDKGINQIPIFSPVFKTV